MQLLRVQAQPTFDSLIYEDQDDSSGLRCSRLLVCLEYACNNTSAGCIESSISEDLRSILTICWSKSEAYNSMFQSDPILKANEVSLLEEIYYLMQLFSEYHDRMELLNVEINFNGRSTMHSLKSLSTLVCDICDLDPPRMSTLFTIIEHCGTLILVQYPRKQDFSNTYKSGIENYLMIVVSAQDTVVHSVPKAATMDDIFDMFLSIISQNSHASRNHASLPFAAVTCVREDIGNQFDHIGVSRDDFMLLLDSKLKEAKKSADVENIRRLRYQLIQLESRSHEFRKSEYTDDDKDTRDNNHEAVQDMKSGHSLRSLHRDVLEDRDAVLEESTNNLHNQELSQVIGNVELDFNEDRTVKENAKEHWLLQPYEHYAHPITHTPKETMAEEKYERISRSSDSSKMSKSEDKHSQHASNENKLHLLSINSPIRVSMSKERFSLNSKVRDSFQPRMSKASQPPASDSKQSSDIMSSSLVSELLRSQDDENILSYISRAYNCIRDRVVLNELDESTTLESTLHSTTPPVNSTSKSQFIHGRPFTADNFLSENLTKSSSTTQLLKNSFFRDESKDQVPIERSIPLDIVATMNSTSEDEHKDSPELGDQLDIKTLITQIPVPISSVKESEHQESAAHFADLPEPNEISKSVERDPVRVSKTFDDEPNHDHWTADETIMGNKSLDYSPAKQLAASNLDKLSVAASIHSERLSEYESASPVRVSTKFAVQSDVCETFSESPLEHKEESMMAFLSSSRDESRNITPIPFQAARIACDDQSNGVVKFPSPSPSLKSVVDSNSNMITASEEPVSLNENASSNSSSAVAVNDLHLSVPSHCLDSKKQSIVTQELISRLESAQILIEYNFYLKAVKQNQVRIEIGKQVLEQFRNNIQPITTRRVIDNEISTPSSSSSSCQNRHTSELRAMSTSEQKVADYATASTGEEYTVVTKKDRVQYDAVGKDSGGRKVTFGNPLGDIRERASSAPLTSRIKISENVREVHSPGNPWTVPQTKSPTKVNEDFQPSKVVNTMKVADPIVPPRVGGILVDVGGEKSSPVAEAINMKRRAQSASAASRRQVGCTQQHAAVAGACNKYNNYQQIKNAVAAVCLAGPQFEVQRAELFDRLEYYFTNGKRTPQLLVQVQSSLYNEVPLVLELKGKINQFLIMFYKSKILSFKGIYVINPINGCVEKIFGKGPKELTDAAVSEYLKFESSSKSFKNLPVRSFSSAVDGVIIDFAKRKK